MMEVMVHGHYKGHGAQTKDEDELRILWSLYVHLLQWNVYGKESRGGAAPAAGT